MQHHLWCACWCYGMSESMARGIYVCSPPISNGPCWHSQSCICSDLGFERCETVALTRLKLDEYLWPSRSWSTGVWIFILPLLPTRKHYPNNHLDSHIVLIEQKAHVCISQSLHRHALDSFTIHRTLLQNVSPFNIQV